MPDTEPVRVPAAAPDRPEDLLDRHGLRERIEIELAGFLDGKLSALTRIDSDLGPVGEAIADLVLDGGKRLRPAFTYWGWRGALLDGSASGAAGATAGPGVATDATDGPGAAAGATDGPGAAAGATGGSTGGPRAAAGSGSDEGDEAAPDADVIRAAAALELVQAGALIHDDVMDRADTRRGKPALHVRFAELHRAGGWRGHSEQFGHSAAIVAGDIALTWAQEMIRTSGLPRKALARLAPAYDDMRAEVMAGQYLDLLAQVDTNRDDAQALDAAWRIARFKAATYTVQRPLHIGALIAGEHPAGDPLLAAYDRYGYALGEAFQLRDDVLGVFGDPAQTGKPAGDDLREGKRTVLVTLARQKSSANGRDLLDRLLGRPDLRPLDVDQLRLIIEGCGALADAEVLIAARVEQARAALADAPVQEEAAAVLDGLAIALTARTR